ncbi:TPA: GGDEF domain-containing protein, partial [Klebsiella pneumoniae]|nr:GGDEF domain-containing protein [Klebsiella pneumoniae]
WGHETGDMALTTFVNIIQHTISNDIIFGRFGGEEFGIIIPSTTMEHTQNLAESIRSNVEMQTKGIFFDKFQHGFTVSIGVLVVTSEKTYSITELISYADKAMYLAKRSGRNRCELTVV